LGVFLAQENRTLADIGMEPRLRYENGNPESWAKLAKDWQNAGATHLTVITMGQGFSTPKEHIQAIKAYANALGI
jgi:hypothetical protein